MNNQNMSTMVKNALAEFDGDLNALKKSLGINEDISNPIEITEKIEDALSLAGTAKTSPVHSLNNLQDTAVKSREEMRLEKVRAKRSKTEDSIEKYSEKIDFYKAEIDQALKNGHDYKANRLSSRIVKLNLRVEAFNERLEKITERESLLEDLIEQRADDEAPNKYPIAVDDNISLKEDGSVLINLLANDSDANGDTVVIASIGTAAHGSIVNNNDGTVTYTPNANFNGADGFDYNVSDGQGGTAAASVSVIVSSVNDVPVSLALSNMNIAEDASVGKVVGTLSASDVDGDTLTFSLVSDADNKFEIVGNEVRLKNSLDFETGTSHDIRVAVSDGFETVTQDYTITVKNVNEGSETNEAPVAVDDTLILPEDTRLVIDILANDSDLDGDTLSIESFGDAANGWVTDMNDGTLRYRPFENFSGSDSFTYTVSDGNGATATGTVYLTVSAINDAPFSLALSSTSIIEDASVGDVVGTLSASDADGDALTFSLVNDVDNKFEIVGNEVRLKNSVDFETDTSHDIEVMVSDGNGEQISQSFSISIKNDTSDDAAVIASELVSLEEDSAVTIDLLSQSSDGSNIISSVGTASNGVIVDNGDGTATYTPKANFFGFDSFSYEISDVNGNTRSAEIKLSVKSVNDAPVVEQSSYTFDVMEFSDRLTFIGHVSAFDIEDNGLTYIITDGFVEGGGLFWINQEGNIHTSRNSPTDLEHEVTPQHNLRIMISDGEKSTPVDVTINVINVAGDGNNASPETEKDRYVIDEDSGEAVLDVLSNDSDPDGDSFRILNINTPSISLGSAVLNNDGTISYTPDENANGGERFEYTVVDAYGNSSKETIIIDIVPVNDNPEQNNESFTLFKLDPTTVSGLVGAIDTDGDDLQITNISDAQHGSVTQNADGTLTYTPDDSLVSNDSFTYTISDGKGGETVVNAEFNIVTTVIANNDSFEVIGARTTTLDVTSNDQFDPDLHTIRVTSLPKEGNVTVNPDGTLALVLRDPSFSGPMSFNYEIEDQDGNVSAGNVEVNVQSSPQLAGWGQGNYYNLQTDSNGNVIVEAGENHRKFFVTDGEHGISRQDIADREGIDPDKVGRWLSENKSDYGSTEELAMDVDIGREFWHRETGNGQVNSNWLLLERGYEYEGNDFISRNTQGESELNPVHITAYGDGEPPLVVEKLKLQQIPKNIVVSNLELLDGIKVYGDASTDEDQNFLFDNIFSHHGVSVNDADDFTLLNSNVVDAHHDAPKQSDLSEGAVWNAFANRMVGFHTKAVDGVLVDNSYFDHNGFATDYSTDLAITSGHPPSLYSHNIYIQYDTSDLTFRNSISARSSSVGAQFRGGGFIEDNVFFENNVAFSTVGGDYKDFGPVGNYSLLNSNITTSNSYREIDGWQGAVGWANQDMAFLSAWVGNIVTHGANPDDPDETVSKYNIRTGLGIQDYVAYNDTIIYRWYGQKLIDKYGENVSDELDINIDGLDTRTLDQITLHRYAADIMNKPDATLDEFAYWLRDNTSNNLDGHTDAELIVRYFQEGFGITPDLTGLEISTLRFVPNELGEGVRWDNRLNWDKGYTPIDGDNIELGGNWVNFGGTVTINDLDFGLNGELSVGNGYLKVDGDLLVDESGARLIVRDSGQFWIDGHDDADMLSITASGGRFANTGGFDGAYSLDVSGNAQVILAAGGNSIFTVDDGDSITIAGSEAKVGFDGSSGDATLKIEDGGVLAFDLDKASTVMIREFKSGHFGDEGPNVNSIVDLGKGDTTLNLDIADIAMTEASYSYKLVGDIDELYGDFETINVEGLGTSAEGASISIDRENDEIRLDLFNDGSLSGLEVNLYASNDVDTFYLNHDTSVVESIYNFDIDGGDRLDLSNIIVGFDTLSDDISDFVLITDDGTNSSVFVDSDGGADNFIKVANIVDVTGIDDVSTLEAMQNVIV